MKFSAALALISTILVPVSGTDFTRPGCDPTRRPAPYPPAKSSCPDQYREADIVTKLDFFESTVVNNTLHLDYGELRYNNVGVFENNVLDLRVTITGGDYTDIAQVWENRNKPSVDLMNGKKPDSKFGNINLQTVKNKPKSGEAQLKFCIVEEGTNNPVTLQEFYFTTYDTDERGVNRGVGIKEKLVIDTSQATLYQLMEDTEIITTCEDGTSPPCQSGRTVFTSSTPGPGSDNPRDPNSLTDQQKARSITFTFQNTSCWEFTYDHYCPADQDDWTGSQRNCKYYTGGNFLFAGDAKEIRIEGQCNTPVPTPLPVPTPQPTVPKTPKTPPPPGTCPEDVVLLKIDGITEIPIDGAVRVLSQNTNTVDVRLYNAWASEQNAIESIFYQYFESVYSDKCYEVQDVPGNDDYADITIQCHHHSPYAFLDIWVADNAVDGNATIPNCCKGDVPEGTPVVFYKLLVYCESQCVETTERRLLRGGATLASSYE